VTRRESRAGLIGLAVLVAALALLSGADNSAPSSLGPRIRFAGQRQFVYDWSKQACEPTQVADLPARAFRDDRGRVQLLLSHFENFRMIGPSLGRLHVDCKPVMVSSDDADPSVYRDRQWIASLYTEDGRHIWALVHDEYQGSQHPGHCPQRRYHPCWYNSVTLAESVDAGRSYRQRPMPEGLVAAAPYRYRPGIGPAGIFTPSNIVTGPDGADYALVRVRDPDGKRGDCLLRTTRIGQPQRWRAWDGTGFDGVFRDPYRSTPVPDSPCAQVGIGRIAEMTESLTFSTRLNRYLLVGMAPSTEPAADESETGIYYSVSDDLIHWSQRILLLSAPTLQSYRCGMGSPIAYPSLIDPSSNSRTFSTSGSRPFLYFTQFRYRNCHRTPNRDLMRVRVEVSG
jgi:hypothetical protein